MQVQKDTNNVINEDAQDSEMVVKYKNLVMDTTRKHSEYIKQIGHLKSELSASS